jgi:peptidoglycan/xylan/chitin deacetylase (PgdA/CDA1 family)
MTSWDDLAARLTTARPLCSLVTHLGRKGAASQGPASPRVSLTFDDGPDREWTPRVLDVLAAHGAHATFFVVGKHVAENADIVRRASSEGHEVAMHLFSHDRSVASDDTRFGAELERTARVIEEVTGRKPDLLRFPHGDLGTQRPRAIRRAGFRVVHWTFSSNDSYLRKSEDIVARVSRLLRPGAIVLLHDSLHGDNLSPAYLRSRANTVEALPSIISVARQRGLEPVTLSTLLAG